MTKGFLALTIAIFANVFLNYFLKQLASETSVDKSHILFFSGSTLLRLCMITFLGSMILAGYFYALKLIPMSVAYPIATSGSLLGVALVAHLWMGETLDFYKSLGFLLVLVGGLLLMRDI